MRKMGLILSARNYQMHGAFMICWGTSWNGAQIGMARNTMRHQHLLTRRVLLRARTGSDGVVAGLTTPSIAVRQTAATARRSPGAMAAASALPHSSNEQASEPSLVDQAGGEAEPTE
jgi:hypothetical protein